MSSEMLRFDRAHMISYYRSVVTMALFFISHIHLHCLPHRQKIAKFIYRTCIQRPVVGEPVGISQSCLVLGKRE